MKSLRAIAFFAVASMLCFNAAATHAGTLPHWVLQGELTGSDNPGALGATVATSGKTVVAGSNGAAYVYVRSGSTWGNMTETAKLTASDGTGLFSVAISGNTNRHRVSIIQRRAEHRLRLQSELGHEARTRLYRDGTKGPSLGAFVFEAATRCGTVQEIRKSRPGLALMQPQSEIEPIASSCFGW